MSEEESGKRFWRPEPLLGVLALLLLLLGCFFVLRPFMTALMWAIILAYSLHPLQKVFTRWFRGSRTLAACFVTLTVTVLLAGPVVWIGMSLAQDGKDLASATRKWFMSAPDEPPSWVGKVPVFGDEIGSYWRELAEDRKRWMEQLDKEVERPPRAREVIEDGEGGKVSEAEAPVVPGVGAEPGARMEASAEAGGKDRGLDDLQSKAVTLFGRFLSWARRGLLSAGLAVGSGVAQVLMSAFLAFFFLKDSQILAERLAVGVERLAGDRGRHLIQVAGSTVRGVIYGILGTAIVQALVAALGFWIAGVPGAVLLAVLTFLFAVVPFGPPMIWLPSSLWLFAQDRPGMGVFLLLWGLLGISSVDNLLRPFLISQGSKMPFALIFCGVIGGALAFGLVGVFLGPTILAVTFRLIDEWSGSVVAAEGGSAISPLPDGGESGTSAAHGGESLGAGRIG